MNVTKGKCGTNWTKSLDGTKGKNKAKVTNGIKGTKWTKEMGGWA